MTNTLVVVPDVGEAKEVEVIEVLVAVGDQVAADDSLIVLESDKASMEIPAPVAGEVVSLSVEIGDIVDEGDPILALQVSVVREEESAPARGPTVRAMGDGAAAAPTVAERAGDEASANDMAASEMAASEMAANETAPEMAAGTRSDVAPGRTLALVVGEDVHAGPAVRKLARELGVDLVHVSGSGAHGRILPEDVHEYVRGSIARGALAEATVDFGKFGATDVVTMSRIRKRSAKNLERSWPEIPQVTHFDEADVTELEAFRSVENDRESSSKLTALPFVMRAAVHCLQEYPRFNASLDGTGDNLILKKYYNVGVAVETRDGLVVPVVRNAGAKGLRALAVELSDLAEGARAQRLPLDAMTGGSFTVSSLGGIGGTGFTPLVRSPEVAILGVARATVQPVWDGEHFQPRTILPLALSYDHRAIDGAEAARFLRHLCALLGDLKRMLL